MAYETSEQLLAEISDYWYKRPGGNMYKLIDAFNEPLEAISDNAYKVERWRALKDAKGTTLDLFGADIQTYRPSQDDDEYRFIIHIMELLSRAQGTVPSIVKITSSALKYDHGFKIWKTGIRHVGMQIPFDAVQNPQMEKFMLNNLQKMLAMGYWLDLIIFKATTHVHGYLGATTQDRDHEINNLVSSWWKGEKVESYNHWYFGTDLQTTDRCTVNLASSWWSGEKENTSTGIYIATKMLIHENLELNSI
ncbi:hypothetical protein [Lactobacillus crispatus]|jgi:hypothetical protein|uniref:hypothetical protein n=1 Tax=Lactobacillus crispatus TaxID=47770 RepID=UPI00105EEB6E|nr:hypothetical protein [Lactobacillus crispatus]TDN11740.1 hypothetical protein CEE83_06830 [Lactobacillus crispatus]